MKQFILAAMLMFTMFTTAFSGGDATAIAPTTTTKREADMLRPTTPLVATFDEDIPADTVHLKIKQQPIK
jgi:hypothetical protein